MRISDWSSDVCSSDLAFVLADDSSPAFMPHAWAVPASMWLDEDKAVEAFRSGKGTPWGDHDGRLHCGVAGFYRNAYRGRLVQDGLTKPDGAGRTPQARAPAPTGGCGPGPPTALLT